MNALVRALEFYEQFDPTEATKAWREFESLLDASSFDRSTLVVICGEPQRIVSTEKIGGRYAEGSRWMREVPVVIVEAKGLPRRRNSDEPEAR